MASSTWDGLAASELQAEPVDTQKPSASSFKSNEFPSIPLKDIFAFPGSLSFLSPFIYMSGILFSTFEI